MITKDYFVDLFGRYAKYLLVIDTILAITFFVLMCVAISFIFKSIKAGENANSYDEGWIFALGASILCTAIFFTVTMISIANVVKDIYIPEVRVMEKIAYKLNNNQ